MLNTRKIRKYGLLVVGGLAALSTIMFAFFNLPFWAPLEKGPMPDFRGLVILISHIGGLICGIVGLAE